MSQAIEQETAGPQPQPTQSAPGQPERQPQEPQPPASQPGTLDKLAEIYATAERAQTPANLHIGEIAHQFVTDTVGTDASPDAVRAKRAQAIKAIVSKLSHFNVTESQVNQYIRAYHLAVVFGRYPVERLSYSHVRALIPLLVRQGVTYRVRDEWAEEARRLFRKVLLGRLSVPATMEQVARIRAETIFKTTWSEQAEGGSGGPRLTAGRAALAARRVLDQSRDKLKAYRQFGSQLGQKEMVALIEGLGKWAQVNMNRWELFVMTFERVREQAMADAMAEMWIETHAAMTRMKAAGMAREAAELRMQAGRVGSEAAVGQMEAARMGREAAVAHMEAARVGREAAVAHMEAARVGREGSTPTLGGPEAAVPPGEVRQHGGPASCEVAHQENTTKVPEYKRDADPRRSGHGHARHRVRVGRRRRAPGASPARRVRARCPGSPRRRSKAPRWGSSLMPQVQRSAGSARRRSNAPRGALPVRAAPKGGRSVGVPGGKRHKRGHKRGREAFA